jgi:hypothetical protein
LLLRFYPFTVRILLTKNHCLTKITDGGEKLDHPFQKIKALRKNETTQYLNLKTLKIIETIKTIRTVKIIGEIQEEMIK